MNPSTLRAWRKWLVRGFVFAVVAGLAAAGVVYQRWTNPAATRRLVMDKLGKEFVATTVSLEGAHLRLLGGIALTDLHLARSTDPDRADFLYVPSAIIYHDKEQLLAGELIVRKIELFRPRLTVRRAADGSWNLDGVLGPTDPNKPMPTIVIHQGTVLLEDAHTANAASVELKDLNLTLLNDPLPTLAFEGSVSSDLAGTVHLKGTRDRRTEELALAVSAPSMTVGPDLVQHLAAYNADVANQAREFRAVVQLDADLAYHPNAEQPFTYDVRCQLSDGKFQHALLPLPLERLQGSLQLVNGRLPLVHLTASSGATELEVTARNVNPNGPRSLAGLFQELDLRAKHLVVTSKLFEPLPQFLQQIQHDYNPAGLATVAFHFLKTPDGSRRHCLFEAEDMQASYEGFPYPLDHVKGTVKVDLHHGPDDVIAIDLAGLASGRPVTLVGEVTGERPCGVKLDIRGQNLPLNEQLIAALPKRYQDLAHSFAPAGLGDVQATIYREQNHEKYANRFLVKFHHATAKYDVFPYPLENLSGTLDIQPDHWEFKDFHATHKGGEFITSGHCYPSAEGDRLEVELKGRNILLDDEMETALKPEPELVKTWDTFVPSGRINFEGTVERLPGEKAEVDLTVSLLGCSIRPEFIHGYQLDDLHGKVRYARRWVELDRLRARHGSSVMSLESGTVYVKPGGGLWAELLRVKGEPLVPDADFLHALPAVLEKGCAALHLEKPLKLSTRLVLDTNADPGTPPVIYWDGLAWLDDATLTTGVRLSHVHGQVACRGLHNGHALEGVAGNVLLKDVTLFEQNTPGGFPGVHLTDLHSQVEVSAEAPDVIKLPGLYARYCGGEIYGPLRVELGSLLRYELKLTASQIQLAQFAEQNQLGPEARMSGLASASLYLSGQGGDLNELRGSGEVAVPEGKIYRLPLLLDMLKVVGLRPPDRTAFEEARANFDIYGTRVHVNHIDLLGNAISLRGQGELNLDGSDINLDFNMDWARLPEMLPAGMKALPHAISDQLLKIKMRGRLGDVHFSKEPVPALFDPFKKVLEGWRADSHSGQGGNAGEPGPVLRATRYVSPEP